MSSALGQGIRPFDVDEAERMLPLIRVIVKGMMDDHAERQALLDRLEGPPDDFSSRETRALRSEIDTLTEKLSEAASELENLESSSKASTWASWISPLPSMVSRLYLLDYGETGSSSAPLRRRIRGPAPARARLTPSISREHGFAGWLRRAVHVRQSEWPLVTTLFGYFFLLTSTQHLLKPARNAFFLTTAGSENLPWAYIAGAVVSGLATIVYARWVFPRRRRQIMGSLISSSGRSSSSACCWSRPRGERRRVLLWYNVFTLLLISQFFLMTGDLSSLASEAIFGFIAGAAGRRRRGERGRGFLAEPLGTGTDWLGCLQLLFVRCWARGYRIGKFRERGRSSQPRAERGP